jgi:hypothetical protein
MASHLISQDVVPIGTGYLILMGVLAAGLRLQRRPAGGTDGSADAGNGQTAAGKVPGRLARRLPAGWPRFAVQVGSTALGGFLVLMAVVIIYYYGVARVAGQFLDSAVTGSALLLGISLPLFAARSWLAERHRRGGQGPKGPRAASGTDSSGSAP